MTKTIKKAKNLQTAQKILKKNTTRKLFLVGRVVSFSGAKVAVVGSSTGAISSTAASESSSAAASVRRTDSWTIGAFWHHFDFSTAENRAVQGQGCVDGFFFCEFDVCKSLKRPVRIKKGMSGVDSLPHLVSHPRTWCW